MNILAEYRTHKTIEDMDNSVNNHIQKNKHDLKSSDIKVLRCLASHSLRHTGACSLKAQTIADEIGLSKATVTRCTKTLKDLGIIETHGKTKLNGIKGANIYSIIFLSHNEPSNEPTNLSHRATHGNTTDSKAEHTEIKTEALSFKTDFNPVVNNVINVNARCEENDFKMSLREILYPMINSEKEFDEFCKISFGKVKKYMSEVNIPYLQLQSIIIQCAKDLTRKHDVRNKFGMYSKMIDRQVMQLFEDFVEKTRTKLVSNKEIVPEWFDNRNEQVVEEAAFDFEAERQKILAKIGG